MTAAGEPASHDVVRVLAAVIRRGRQVLLCRRPAHKRHGGMWEFPGGKLEPGEDLLAAARRELREELGVDVLAAGTAVFTRHDADSPFLIEFTPVTIRGEPAALEHEEVRWVEAREALRLQLAPADDAFLREFLLDAAGAAQSLHLGERHHPNAEE